MRTLPLQRGDVHDGARALFQHARQDGAVQPDCGQQVGAEGLHPVVLGQGHNLPPGGQLAQSPYMGLGLCRDGFRGNHASSALELRCEQEVTDVPSSGSRDHGSAQLNAARSLGVGGREALRAVSCGSYLGSIFGKRRHGAAGRKAGMWSGLPQGPLRQEASEGCPVDWHRR